MSLVEGLSTMPKIDQGEMAVEEFVAVDLKGWQLVTRFETLVQRSTITAVRRNVYSNGSDFELHFELRDKQCIPATNFEPRADVEWREENFVTDSATYKMERGDYFRRLEDGAIRFRPLGYFCVFDFVPPVHIQ